jgi:aryl-alcohol dehydrogenase-like predicted oxidoreductase
MTQLGIGTAAWGQPYGFDSAVDLPTARTIYNRARDLGFTFIDTARSYGNSESTLGAITNGDYSGMTLCTKLSPYFYADTDSDAAIRKHIRKSIRDSLESLRTEHVDILLVHNLTIDDARCLVLIDELQRLKQAGMASQFGGSIYDLTLPLRVPRVPWQALEVPYSALDRRIETTLPQREFFYIARSVFLRGALTGVDNQQLYQYPHLYELRAKVAALRSIATDTGVSLANLAMNYVLSNPLIDVALVGASSVADVQKAAFYASCPRPASWIMELVRTVRVYDEDQLWPGKW